VIPEVDQHKKNGEKKKDDSAKASIGQKLPFLCVKQSEAQGPPVRNTMYTEELHLCPEATRALLLTYSWAWLAEIASIFLCCEQIYFAGYPRTQTQPCLRRRSCVRFGSVARSKKRPAKKNNETCKPAIFSWNLERTSLQKR